MYIKVKGGNRQQKKLVSNVVLYAAGALMSSRMLGNLYCKVNVKNLLQKEGIYGACVWNDSNVRPRSFIIDVDRDLDENTFIETLCHETVHLKQYVMNQLRERYKPAHRVLWYEEDCSKFKYEDQPWELEASMLENSLARGFNEYKYLIK